MFLLVFFSFFVSVSTYLSVSVVVSSTSSIFLFLCQYTIHFGIIYCVFIFVSVIVHIFVFCFLPFNFLFTYNCIYYSFFCQCLCPVFLQTQSHRRAKGAVYWRASWTFELLYNRCGTWHFLVIKLQADLFIFDFFRLEITSRRFFKILPCNKNVPKFIKVEDVLT